MPFRERVKRAFGRSGSQSDGSGLSLAKTTSSKNNPNVYQPGEPMPRPKYRAPVDKQHKERLEAFTFADNFRRKSIQSQYSPMGSRIPSRNNSLSKPNPRKFFSRGPSYVGRVVENADDDADVANVGGPSTRHSKDGIPAFTTNSSKKLEKDKEAAEDRANGYAHDHQPFSEADLTDAMMKANRQMAANGASTTPTAATAASDAHT